MGNIGPAAVGAWAENPSRFAICLVFTVLPETIIILGLVLALMLFGKIQAPAAGGDAGKAAPAALEQKAETPAH
jgi:hypothetical protein